MTGAIHLEDTLRKAESIYLQFKQSKKLPNHLKEILGFEITDDSATSSARSTPASTPIIPATPVITPTPIVPASAPTVPELVPKLELSARIRENGFSNPSSGSGTAVSTPNNDSSIEILADNCEMSVNNFYNWA